MSGIQGSVSLLDTHREHAEEKGDVQTEAEIGVMWPQPRKEMLMATRSWPGRAGSLLEPPE